jgi:hypothetical protein
MKRVFADLVAAIAYAMAVKVMATRSDAWIVRRLDFAARVVRRLAGDDAGVLVVLREAAQIFESGPEASRIARSFILDARPEQFKALVRGAILD